MLNTKNVYYFFGNTVFSNFCGKSLWQFSNVPNFLATPQFSTLNLAVYNFTTSVKNVSCRNLTSASFMILRPHCSVNLLEVMFGTSWISFVAKTVKVNVESARPSSILTANQCPIWSFLLVEIIRETVCQNNVTVNGTLAPTVLSYMK